MPSKYQLVIFKDAEFNPYATNGSIRESFNALARRKFGFDEAAFDPDYLGDILGIANAGGHIYAVQVDRAAAEKLAQEKNPDVMYIGDWPEGTGPSPGAIRKTSAPGP